MILLRISVIEKFKLSLQHLFIMQFSETLITPLVLKLYNVYNTIYHYFKYIY